jgi:3-hydroxy-3-methylglutaryl CoA synthase
MVIAQNMAWYFPVIFAVAQGEKAVANWDEDAVSMAVAASAECMEGRDRKAIDGVYLASTTLPFADRQNAGIVAAALNTGEAGTVTADFSSSPKACTAALLAALEGLKSGSKKNVLVAASDLRRAKMATMHEMFYGDGAAALLLGSGDVIAEFKDSYSHSCDFIDHYRGAEKAFDYYWEERWIRDEGYAKIIPAAISGYLAKTGTQIGDYAKIVFPCYYKREHANIGKKLKAEPPRLQDNMHEICGDTGTAHPLLMLTAAFDDAKPGDKILLASFGQGCDVLGFEVTKAIEKYKRPIGVKGHLAKRVELTIYQKYAKFRDLITADLGIRGEANPNNSLTALWRNRKMIIGFCGGKCVKCGTIQFPITPMCVNPKCNAVGAMEEYEFAHRDGSVMSFTWDLLAASVDPPAMYGLITFEGGGRAFVDFTDCDMNGVKIGMPVRMTFRKRYDDRTRGYTGYFWKAVPQAK